MRSKILRCEERSEVEAAVAVTAVQRKNAEVWDPGLGPLKRKVPKSERIVRSISTFLPVAAPRPLSAVGP